MKYHNFCMVIGQRGNERVVAMTSYGSPDILLPQSHNPVNVHGHEAAAQDFAA